MPSSGREHALDADDVLSVLMWTDRVIECGATGTTLGALCALQADVHNWQDQPETARQCRREAMELLAQDSDSDEWARAAGYSIWSAYTVSSYEDIEEIGDVLVRIGYSKTRESHLIALAMCIGNLLLAGPEQRAGSLRTALEEALDQFAVNSTVRAEMDHMDSLAALFCGAWEPCLATLGARRRVLQTGRE